MSSRRSSRLAMRIAALGLTALGASAAPAEAQETVGISVPMGVSFTVADVSRSTSGAPSVTTITFSNANHGKILRVSVQPDAAAFSAPSGPTIPASAVSWSNLGTNGGFGSSGSLSSSSYVQVFQSDPPRTSGRADLGWTLAPPPSGIRAGVHQLTLRWKIESITP